jgi:hypothetical protein
MAVLQIGRTDRPQHCLTEEMKLSLGCDNLASTELLVLQPEFALLHPAMVASR